MGAVASAPMLLCIRVTSDCSSRCASLNWLRRRDRRASCDTTEVIRKRDLANQSETEQTWFHAGKHCGSSSTAAFRARRASSLRSQEKTASSVSWTEHTGTRLRPLRTSERPPGPRWRQLEPGRAASEAKTE